MVGRTICIVDNLKPRKIFGIMSEGMILAANHPDGAIVLIAPASDLPPGAEIS
jgi:methionyl-tRNA synthetase